MYHIKLNLKNFCSYVLSFQDEKNQLMTTNVWMKQAGTPLYLHLQNDIALHFHH